MGKMMKPKMKMPAGHKKMSPAEHREAMRRMGKKKAPAKKRTY